MVDKPIEQNIFDAIIARADHVNPGWGGNAQIARCVIQTIIDLTPSPRTVDELTRILAQEAQPAATRPPEGETMQGRPYNPSTVLL